MTTEAFEKTSWGWQLSQLQQQVGEWIEYQFSRLEPVFPKLLPEWSISPWLSDFLKYLFWISLTLFLVWVAWRFWREFNPYLYSWLAQTKNPTNAGDKVNEKDLNVATWLGRSQELYWQGNYRDACRCLYLAALQHLHDRKLIPHKKSRTDGEYLQLLGLSVSPMQAYETLITTHERLCFDNAEILPENYEQCRQAYGGISQE